MRGWTVFLLVLSTGCGGCAGKNLNTEPVSQEPDTSGIIALVGRFGIASGCPISPNEAIIAGHSADVRPFDPDFPLIPYPWSDEEGNDGMILPIRSARYMDAAYYEIKEARFKKFYPLAEVAPQPGDTVWWTEYDFSSQDRAFMRITRKSKVTRVVARHIITRDAPVQGASGSCVLNSLGQTVGIVAFGKSVGDNRSIFQKEVGGITGLWGELASDLTRPEVVE